MDYAIKNSSEEFLLILDSDVSLKSTLIEPMIKDFTGISKGLRIIINKDGVSSLQSNRTENQNFSYPYIHPYCMLIDRNKYISFKPFKKHGAPCIDFMMDVYEKGQSDQLIHFDINDYVNLVIRGTRSKWGINL